MRNASRLCRGLSEAAQSIERPYIPRHVPLPSSSYSATGPTSARTSPPAAFDKGHFAGADLRGEDDAFRSPRKADSLRAGLTRHQLASPIASQHSTQAQVPSAVLSPEEAKEVRQPLPASSTDIRDPPSIPMSASGAIKIYAQRRNHRQHASTPLANPPPELVSKAKQRRPSTKRLSSEGSHRQSPHPKSPMSYSLMNHVRATYPALTDPQASLLLETFSRIQSPSSQVPSAVISWYEDRVWTVERQSEGTERTESAQSISMLMRYAYQRNDLRSLLRMESRAARFRPSDPQSSAGTLAPAAVSKLPELANVDDVPTWPARDENPKALAYNLKVAFAARQGDWVKVEELLDNADLLSSAPTKPNRDHRGTPKRRSGMTLDAIGWGSLLRHGLGNVQKLDVAGLSTAAGADASSEEPRSRSHDLTASTHPNDQSSDDPDDKLKKAKEEAQQMQAKLSVTKRLLPNLLRSMSRSASVARSSNLAGDESKAPAEVAESSTPSWLLQSVLAQLAERGETASAIRIVQLALSEASPSLGNNAADRRTATHVLNLALQACGHNGRIRIAETLRIFNSLTSSQLGHDISGSTVLIQPRVLSDFKKPREDAKNELTSVIVPNEESLVLLLKKVCHPLFRASWTRRLVDDFERLFPQVSVSGRTFRMILANCLAPAPAPALAGVPASMPAVRERVVASGRRGRRLRQAAATNNTASASPDVTVATAREPRLKVSILSQTLETILTRFAHFTAAHDPSRRLHLSTTNRLRFEHTLLRAKRMLLVKRAAHQEALRSIAAVGKRKRMTTHHTHAITQINIALDRIAAVQRLGRCEEAHWKRHARTSTADQR